MPSGIASSASHDEGKSLLSTSYQQSYPQGLWIRKFLLSTMHCTELLKSAPHGFCCQQIPGGIQKSRLFASTNFMFCTVAGQSRAIFKESIPTNRFHARFTRNSLFLKNKIFMTNFSPSPLKPYGGGQNQPLSCGYQQSYPQPLWITVSIL